MALRFLADENVPAETVRQLRERGLDVTTVTPGLGIADRLILEQAQRELRVVVTFDKDFGALAFRSGLPAEAGVILIRMMLEGPEETGLVIASAVASRDDWPGHFSVIEADGIRMTPLPPT